MLNSNEAAGKDQEAKELKTRVLISKFNHSCRFDTRPLRHSPDRSNPPAPYHFKPTKPTTYTLHLSLPLPLHTHTRVCLQSCCYCRNTMSCRQPPPATSQEQTRHRPAERDSATSARSQVSRVVHRGTAHRAPARQSIPILHTRPRSLTTKFST